MEWLWSDFFIGFVLGVFATVWVLGLRSVTRHEPVKRRPDMWR